MSATGRYRYLFSPLRIGPVVVRNRIVFSAHLTNYAEDGLPSQQHADYFAARAAGGVGLIITEEHSTHPTDWPYEKLIHGFHRAVIPGYRNITAAVHAHDVPIFAQLNHNGGQASSMFSRLPVWAPSPVPDPMFREVPKAVERHEIAEIVAGYGTVAGHCAEGGFDGIELQCSHSSIVRGFLSPATNKRTDAYGGSLAARAGGRPGYGRVLSAAGLFASTIGAYLGGHLALRLGAGTSHAEQVSHLSGLGWHDLCGLAELPDRRPVRRQLGYLSLLVYRQAGEVSVLSDRCSHLGGPLHQGRVAAERGASRVISIDGQTPRLEMARKCGATDVIDMNELTTPEARVQRVKDLTDGRGADVVVHLPAQTMADDRGGEPSLLPMGSLYEAAQLVFFDLVSIMLREQTGQAPDDMRERHTNLE